MMVLCVFWLELCSIVFCIVYPAMHLSYICVCRYLQDVDYHGGDDEDNDGGEVEAEADGVHMCVGVCVSVCVCVGV